MDRRAIGRSTGLTARMALTFFLVVCLYAGIVVLAYVLYRLWPGGWPYFLAVAVALAFSVAAHSRTGVSLLVRAAGGRMLAPHERPQLHERVERLAAVAEIPTPRLALIDSPVANAFAVGIRQRSSAIAVTTSLLDELTGAEVDAVLAHELAHIANRDAAVMTVAGIPRSIGEWLIGGAGVSVVALVWLLVWPLGIPLYAAAMLVMLTLSRYREFAADRGSALITGQPEELMSALVKLARHAAPESDLRLAGVEALCIVPFREPRLAFLRDHPPLEQRLAALEQIAREMGRPAS